VVDIQADAIKTLILLSIFLYYISMHDLFSQILQSPFQAFLIIGNLIIIESLLSIDNAAVLATMVMDLPKEQRGKALRYGIIGAYVFRGICLVFVSFLISVWWLKPLGGLYLLYLALGFFKEKISKGTGEAEVVNKNENWLFKRTVGWMGPFWATVALVEVMDLAFSIDNVFAAVAFSNNIIIICAGVFTGILAMRFVARAFVALMEKYPVLEYSAFVVIGVLGIKLMLSLFEHFSPRSPVSLFLGSHLADWLTSALTVAIFLFPLLISVFTRKRTSN
jgi:YkoY family integral membrane protein